MPPKTRSQTEKAPEGVQFPVTNAETGERSTTTANSGTFAASVKDLDKEMSASISSEGRKWRRKYSKYVVKNVELSVKSPQNALTVAQAGLDHMHSTFEFVRDGKTMSVKEAMKSITGSFETGVVKGKGKRPKNFELEVPYTKYGTDKGTVLKGDALLIQLEHWVNTGVIEPSCGAAIAKVVTNKEWLDLSDKHFVLLGAGSAMGPLLMLLSLGANIIAIDYHAAPIWKRLIGLVEDSCGTMTFPMKKPQSECKGDELYANAGCDLFCDAPELRTWLCDMDPKRELVIGAYAYMDGEKFVRISLAMDAIIQDVIARRAKGSVTIAYLCTPTDAHVVPAASVDWCKKKMRRVAQWWHPLVTLASGGKALAKNARKPVVADDGEEFFVCDAIVNEQGPNYILAKRLQHWRSILARDAGCTVSTNIAPSTATLSVVSNLSFKIAYGGFAYFTPMEVFLQDTSNAVMGAMLIHDVRNDTAAANPNTALRNPLELFSEGSFHGGAWRCPYKFGSIGGVAAVTYIWMEFIVKFYLLLYNVAQVGGWGLGLYRVIQHAMNPTTAATVWEAASVMGYFQMWTMLEVLHSALGFVRASAVTTFLQVFSRVFVVSVVMQAPQVQNIWSVWLFALAWSITEVVRYSYYALGLFKIDVKPLTFLRYTMFLALYPLGVLGEVVTVYSAGPHLKELVMGPLGFTSLLIDYGSWLKYLIGPVYAMGLPFLYMHMLAQRKKVLGGGGKGKGKGKGGKSKKE